MLHEFMENELPTNREETLFHALARDEDLRFEMKYLLSLRTAVQEDDEAGVVPLASTQSLFSRLGYAAAIPAAESVAGVAGAAGAASAGAGSGFGTIFRGWGSHLLAGLVGMLLAGTFFVIGEPANGSNNGAIAENGSNGDRAAAAAVEVESSSESERLADNAVSVDRGDVTPAAEPSAASLPVAPPAVRSGPRAERRSPSTPSARQDLRDVADAVNSRSPIANDNGNGLIDTTSEASGNATTTLGTDIVLGTNRSVELVPTVAAASDPTAPNEFLDEDLSERIADRPVQLPEQEYETYGHVNFTARGSMVPVNVTKSKLGLDMDEKGKLDRNFALGIEYALSSDLTFSLEMGVESYLMYFREERSNGVINEYEAISSPLWANGSLRWTPVEVGPVPLFVQGGIGASWSGPMARIMLGGEFDLEESVTLIGGAELSTIGYQYQNELLFSPRFGLTGGIRLNNLFRKK